MTTVIRPAIWANRIVGHGEIDPAQVLANPRNVRRHTREQKDHFRAIARDVGVVAPIMINMRTGFLVDGHLRVEVALEDGQPLLPYDDVDLTDEQERKLLLAYDYIGSLAYYDAEAVAALLDETASDDAAMQALLDEIQAREGRLRRGELREGLGDPDAVPLPPRTTSIERGDAWLLGSHILLCGDATEPEDVRALLAGAEQFEADLLVTDPPYGVAYVGKTAEALTFAGDEEDDAATRLLVADALRAAPLKAGGAFYVFSPAGNTETAFRLGIADAGYQLRQCLVWVKQHFVMGRQDYHWRHESILYGWHEGAAHYFVPDRTLDTVYEDDLDLTKATKAQLLAIAEAVRDHPQTTVLREDRPHRSDMHPTMKPAALVRRLIANSSRPGDLVLDLFGGSGTTLIAAEQLDRRCAMVEIDPLYCDVILKRWAEFSGEPATLIARLKGAA